MIARRPPWFAPLAIVLAVTGARAEDFYRGKTLELVVSEAVGGGSDTAARLASRHLARHLAGNPGIILRNSPGAGGLAAVNSFYNLAPRDGLHIAMIEQSIYATQLFRMPGLLADTRKLNWLGRVISNNAVLVAWHTSIVKNIDDVYSDELTVSATGLSSQMRWNMMKKLMGMKLRLIVGLQGSAEASLAMQRGEVDAFSAPWIVFRVGHADWLRDHKVNVLLQSNMERASDLPDTPRYIDLARDDEQRRILELFSRPDQVGRSFAAPPDTPPERIAELRAAFSAMFQDPAYLADAAAIQLQLDPLDGAAMQEIITRSFDTPAQLVEKAEALARP